MNPDLRNAPIEIAGWGAVSPAGWGSSVFLNTDIGDHVTPAEDVTREGCDRPLNVRRVPKPEVPLPFLRDPRLRRASPVARFSVGAAFEAIGEERIEAVKSGDFRLGVIYCFVNGCVTYSHRFYDEVLNDPSLASPILFPETVYNAPASHLGAMLGSHEINYTLVGDSAQFINGLEIAARWLQDDLCDGAVVAGCEEFDWVTAEGFQLFEPETTFAEGAGALYLERAGRSPGIQLAEIAGPLLYTNRRPKSEAIREAAESIQQDWVADSTLFDRSNGVAGFDAAETEAWRNWPGERVSVIRSLGEGMGASVAWQCVAAVQHMKTGDGKSAVVSAAGENEQAAIAVFTGG